MFKDEHHHDDDDYNLQQLHQFYHNGDMNTCNDKIKPNDYHKDHQDGEFEAM
jgi:hypothetical protein